MLLDSWEKGREPDAVRLRPITAFMNKHRAAPQWTRPGLCMFLQVMVSSRTAEVTNYDSYSLQPHRNYNTKAVRRST